MMDMIPDRREMVELRVERDELYQWMLAAHLRDITLNQFIERAIRAKLDELELDN